MTTRELTLPPTFDPRRLPGRLGTMWTWICLVWLLVGPRIPLLGASNSSIRIEDVLLLSLFVVVVPRWSLVRALPAYMPGIGIVFWVSMVAVVAAALEGKISFVSGVLYGARPMEYWVIYPALLLAFQASVPSGEKTFVGILRTVTALQVGVAGLQYLGLSIGFSKFSYSRGAGLTAGPYELGAVCAALGCYWVGTRRWGWAALSLAGLLLSASRISLAAFIAGALVIVLWRAFGKRMHPSTTVSPPKALRVISFTLAIMAGIAFSPAITTSVAKSVGNRIDNTSLVRSWLISGNEAGVVGTVQTSAQYLEVAYNSISQNVNYDSLGQSGDASNLVRFFRWHLLLNSVDTPQAVVLGQGPSFAGPSVDGSFLRIFVEAGFLGLIAWGILFGRIVKRSEPWLIAVVFTILIGGLFIDLLFAMRPMILIWAFIAHSRASESSRSIGVAQPSTEVRLSS